MSYHLKEIERGVYGEASKIREEFEEFMDAHAQRVAVMELVELSDLIGAIEGYVESSYGLTLNDLLAMNRVTKRAFNSGHREPRNSD